MPKRKPRGLQEDNSDENYAAVEKVKAAEVSSTSQLTQVEDDDNVGEDPKQDVKAISVVISVTKSHPSQQTADGGPCVWSE